MSRILPAWQVISWALAVSLPAGLLLLLTVDFASLHQSDFAFKLTGSLLYLGLISQYGGFLLWYRALALDGVARASQIQLSQPFLTLIGAWLLLGESIDVVTIVFAVLILLTIVISRQVRIVQPS